MAVHNVGYRGWSGLRTADWTRSSVITATGFRRAWQSKWLRRMLFFAWLPAIWFGVGFFVWEQSVLYPDWRRLLIVFLDEMPGVDEISGAIRNFDSSNPGAARHMIWSWLLSSFFRYPQGTLMVLVVGIIAPPLISQDVRSRAFLLYFSRPLTRTEYVIGKSATIWGYLAMISTVPALCLYVLGILLSPDLSVIWATWDLPFRVLAASAVLMLPTASLALLFSSMTQETRYAGFAWFAVWILGWFTYAVMTSADALLDNEVFVAQPRPIWSYLSLYHTLGRVESWIFGFADFSDVFVSALILIAITVVANILLMRRISAPMRV